MKRLSFQKAVLWQSQRLSRYLVILEGIAAIIRQREAGRTQSNGMRRRRRFKRKKRRV
jgi:hypothetical protein